MTQKKVELTQIMGNKYLIIIMKQVDHWIKEASDPNETEKNIGDLHLMGPHKYFFFSWF